jgi:glycosyltransferase involved in cell wall biosynthesis
MSAGSPLVSICIPVYNAVAYIEETVDCFLNQTYSNIEIIINDDCSNDGTWERLQRFCDNPKVRLYRNSKNTGIGPNWNTAYDYAKGEYVVIANADDLYKNDFIEKGIYYFTKYSVAFVPFSYQIINDSDKSLKNVNSHQSEISGIVNGFDVLNRHGAFHIIFTLFKRELIEKCKINGLAFMNTQVCDYEFLLRYSYYNPNAYFSNEIIGYYRIHDTNNSKKPLGEMKSYFYDVLPSWDERLKEYSKSHYPPGTYRKRRRDAFVRYLKGVIRGRQPFDSKLFKTIFLFYIKSL